MAFFFQNISKTKVMGYTRTEYPFQMSNLAPMVRAKAIEIVNELLRERIELQTAISTAIVKARDWVADSQNNNSTSGS